MDIRRVTPAWVLTLLMVAVVWADGSTVPEPSSHGQGQEQGRPVSTGGSGGSGSGRAPDLPSGRFVGAENAYLRISHPDNWEVHGQGDALTITPRGGLVVDGQGNQALAYGVIVNVYEPRGSDDGGQPLQGPGYGQGSTQAPTTRLERSTDELVQELRLSNRNLRVIRDRETIRVDGATALSTYLSNDSPAGGRETDWLVTLDSPDGLLFIVCTAPESEVQRYESTFHEMMRSVRLRR